MHRVRVRVVEDALDANNTIARANRDDFDRAGVTVVNLMSAPGAGKTTLLEKVLGNVGDLRVGVLEGDVQGTLDADRLTHLHIPVAQLQTDQGFGGALAILAAPFEDDTRVRLNEIKQREQFRPIAPVCLEDDAARWFGCHEASPFMLYTYRANTKALPAVTHVNGTARIPRSIDDVNPRVTITLPATRDQMPICALVRARSSCSCRVRFAPSRM